MTNQLHNHPGIFENDPRNGRGLASMQPLDPSLAAAEMTLFEQLSTFPDARHLLDRADEADNASIIIEGGPGAGKSHLRNDVFWAAALRNRPVMSVQMHIACGKTALLGELAADMLDFSLGQTEQPLLIVDNVDYFGYKGNRTATAAARAIETVGSVIRELIESSDVTVIALAHTPSWRKNHWALQRQDVREAAGGILMQLGSPLAFDGEMIPSKAVAHLCRQGVEASDAEAVTAGLQDSQGVLLFRHVHHLMRYLNPDSHQKIDIDLAVKCIDSETADKLQGRKLKNQNLAD